MPLHQCTPLDLPLGKFSRGMFSQQHKPKHYLWSTAVKVVGKISYKRVHASELATSWFLASFSSQDAYTPIEPT